MSASTAAHHYNPDWLDDDALLAGFIARQPDFDFLRDELARAPLAGTVQHHLLVGQRGAGKTTLLKRLAVAIRRDADLNDHLIALSFPEELYQVKTLDDFWWAACEALGDELERRGDHEAATRVFGAVDQARATSASPADKAAGSGLALLSATCAALGRRPVMLVDNLDFVIRRIEQGGRSKHKGPPSTTYWSLREALSTAASPIVIGGAVTLSEPFTDYDKAFYDFFLPTRLGRLPLAEVRRMLDGLADRQGLPEVKARIAERPGRVDTLNELTGGNPRAVGLIFELLRQGPNGRAVSDFERLMDMTTPYYKARFEDLAEQAQVVMHALAVRRHTEGSLLRFGHTAAEVAAFVNLPTNTISAQMDVLLREGLVEKSPGPGRTQYRIAEQLFRLWLQMRGSRRVRQNVIGLAEFFQAWFDQAEMTAQLSDATGRSGALLSFAVAETAGGALLRHGLSAHGVQLMLAQSRLHGEDLGECFAPGDLPQDVAELLDLRERLHKARGGGLSEEEQQALLGAVRITAQQRAASVAKLCVKASAKAEVASVRALLEAERAWLLRHGLIESDLPLLYQLRAAGQLPLPALRPGDAEAAALTHPLAEVRPMVWRLVGAPGLVHMHDDDMADAWLQWAQMQTESATSEEWARLARTLRRSGRLSASGLALSQAFERGDSAEAWSQKGALLADSGGEVVDVEWAYRKALELDPKFAAPWYNLGNLLAWQPARTKEAEQAYHQAIGIDPAFANAWHSLGRLLVQQLNQPAEGERAYEQAIKLDPLLAEPWGDLGALLSHQPGREMEAEAAFQKAISLDPGNAHAWNNFGNLLANRLSRYDEAEAAYRRAIELNPTLAHTWTNLAGVLSNQPGRVHEAETAYRNASELDPTDSVPWGMLGNLLLRLTRFDEALAALDQALILASTSDLLRSLWTHSYIWARAGRDARCIAVRFRAGDLVAVESALTELSAAGDLLPELLAADTFLKELLIPTLSQPDHAAMLLAEMRDLGFDKAARPLMLAFEAAALKRPELLETLEPEVREVATQIHAKLVQGH